MAGGHRGTAGGADQAPMAVEPPPHGGGGCVVVPSSFFHPLLMDFSSFYVSVKTSILNQIQ